MSGAPNLVGALFSYLSLSEAAITEYISESSHAKAVEVALVSVMATILFLRMRASTAKARY